MRSKISSFPHGPDLETGFIRESPEKLRRIVHHFRAHLGQAEPVAPRCNAPWVSAVVETDGAVRPCFFHEPIGNLMDQSLGEALNGPQAQAFRASLNVAENPVCRRCVCSLYLPDVSKRRVRYQVAASLDGYIAGPNGEIDWITRDPDIDFGQIFSQFDTLLIGRGTFDEMVKQGNDDMPGMKLIVFSRTLQEQDYPNVTIVAEKAETVVAELKEKAGKDICLFGGGALFRYLAEAGLVDTVEVAVMPTLLGGGTPLLPGPAPRIALALTSHRIYKTGIALLEYRIV